MRNFNSLGKRYARKFARHAFMWELSKYEQQKKHRQQYTNQPQGCIMPILSALSYTILFIIAIALLLH
jgi:hypothetical protein